MRLSSRYRYFDTKVPEILSWARGGVINMAGGIPDPAAIPPSIGDIAMDVIRQHSDKAFQYGDTQGLLELRREITRFKGFGDPDGVVVTVGSQEGLDIIGKTFIGPQDTVAVEDPTYFVALPILKTYSHSVVSIPIREGGLDMDKLEETARSGLRLLYLMPSIQNPTGRVMSLDERKAVLELAEKYDFHIVEDDPYSSLSMTPLPPSMAQLDPYRVLHLSTFSKIIAPGLRVGFIITTKEASNALINVKSATTISTPPLSQLIAAEFLKRGLIRESIDRARQLYWSKLTVISTAVREAGLEFQEPVGGFFIWLNTGIDADALLREALKLGVAFMPGRYFSPSGSFSTWIRISASQVTIEEGRLGVKRLANAIQSLKH
ncbi:MAG: PLP-dependent aminotransferase family protein [Thermocladium sp.]